VISNLWIYLSPLFVYLLFIFPSILHGRLYLIGDNLLYHYPVFAYAVNSLKFGYGFPVWLPPKLSDSSVWFPSEGGIPIDLLAVNQFPLLLHRVVGYAIALLPGVKLIVAYKISILMGILLALLGWWLFLRLRFGGALASVGTTFLLFSGIGFSPFHQEQALATMEYVPWLLYAASRVREHPLWIVLSAFILSTLLTQHYPHIHGAVLVVFLLYLWWEGLFLKAVQVVKVAPAWSIVMSMAVFVVGLFPLYRVWQLQSEIVSPLRDFLNVVTLADYVRLNQSQMSSAPVAYLLHLLMPFYRVGWVGGRLGQWGDQFGFSMSPICTALAIYGAFVGRASRRLFLFLVVLLLLCLGINGGVPQVLYIARVPFLELFRQWYHFHPYVLLCLSYLAVQFLSSLDGACGVGIKGSNGEPILKSDLKNGAVIILLVVVPLYGILFFQSFVSYAFLKSEKFVGNEAVEGDLKGRYEYLYEALPIPETEKRFRPPLFLSREYALMESRCIQAADLRPGMTSLGSVLMPRLMSQSGVPAPDVLCSLPHGVRTVSNPQGIVVYIDEVAPSGQERFLFLPYPGMLGLRLEKFSHELVFRETGEYQLVENTLAPQSSWPSPLHFQATSVYPVFMEVWYGIGVVLVGGCLVVGRRNARRLVTSDPISGSL
jgi:hypothetical protein